MCYGKLMECEEKPGLRTFILELDSPALCVLWIRWTLSGIANVFVFPKIIEHYINQ